MSIARIFERRDSWSITLNCTIINWLMRKQGWPKNLSRRSPVIAKSNSMTSTKSCKTWNKMGGTKARESQSKKASLIGRIPRISFDSFLWNFLKRGRDNKFHNQLIRVKFQMNTLIGSMKSIRRSFSCYMSTPRSNILWAMKNLKTSKSQSLGKNIPARIQTLNGDLITSSVLVGTVSISLDLKTKLAGYSKSLVAIFQSLS